MAMDALDAFSRDLHRAQEEWASVVGIFRDHLVGRFLDDFIAREITALGNDVGHVVPKSVGQANFTFINTPDFEYSVRALAPFPARRHPVKWLGMRQIIGVKGRGSATVRKLAVPPHLDIACFQPGAAIDALDLLTATDGDVIGSHTPHEILDVHEVSSPVVVEVLTHRRDDAGLIWTFDPDLRSLYAEQSSLTVSRFRNVLELAHAAGKPVPDEIYELALDPSRPHTALLAIRSMLMSGHPEAFVQLHRAMESGSDELRQGAERLFDAMTMARGGSHAT